MKDKKTKKKIFFRAHLEKQLKDAEFHKEYDDVDAEVRLAVEIAEARESAGLSQAQLAMALHTKQSNISRIERGAQNVTAGTLKKIAKALHCRLYIQIRHA